MDIEEIQRRQVKALEYHHMKYNCAQSVACAICDLVGIDSETAFVLTEGFGGGMGGFTQTCGAVSGAILCISKARCEGSQKLCSKQATYELSKRMVEAFQKQNGKDSALCGNLRPAEKELVMPTCDGYISLCVKIALEILDENKLI